MHEDAIRAAVAACCEAGNVEGFRCSCPHPVDGWCLGGRLEQQARAAITAFLAKAHENTDPEDTMRYCLLAQLRNEISATPAS